MSKSIDLGRKLSELVLPQAAGPEDTHYPDLYISDSEDPAIADMPDKREATIKYRVVSRHHSEERSGKGKKHSCSIRLEILSITPPKKENKKGGYGDDARSNFKNYFNGDHK